MLVTALPESQAHKTHFLSTLPERVQVYFPEQQLVIQPAPKLHHSDVFNLFCLYDPHLSHAYYNIQPIRPEL